MLLGNARHKGYVHHAMQTLGRARSKAAEPVGFGGHRGLGGGEDTFQEGSSRGSDATLFIDHKGHKGVVGVVDAQVAAVFLDFLVLAFVKA